MGKEAFIFSKWENRAPYYALKGMDPVQLCQVEKTWVKVRSLGLRTALTVTFGAGWKSVATEAGKHALKYGGRKALGCVTTVVCGYFGGAAVCLITKSAKILKIAKCFHGVCASGLDVAELCAACPIHIVEIGIFGRPLLLDDSAGFAIIDGSSDPVEDLEQIFKGK